MYITEREGAMYITGREGGLCTSLGEKGLCTSLGEKGGCVHHWEGKGLCTSLGENVVFGRQKGLFLGCLQEILHTTFISLSI